MNYYRVVLEYNEPIKKVILYTWASSEREAVKNLKLVETDEFKFMTSITIEGSHDSSSNTVIH
jgi:hypothetical protein